MRNSRAYRKRGKVLQPKLDTCVLFHQVFAVVGVRGLCGRWERCQWGLNQQIIAEEMLAAPDYAPGFEVDGCPVALVVEGDAADEDGRRNGAFWLLLLQGGVKTVDTGVALNNGTGGSRW